MTGGKIYLTPEGLQKIKEELEELKGKSRPEVVERLSLARLQGDLSENNEYVSAKEQLAFIDGRIEELEEVVKNASLVAEKSSSSPCVGIGCRVTVDSGKNQVIYHIVGEWEANPAERKISHSSPLGQALIGKKVGDEVQFDAPVGKISYKICKIE